MQESLCNPDPLRFCTARLPQHLPPHPAVQDALAQFGKSWLELNETKIGSARVLTGLSQRSNQYAHAVMELHFAEPDRHFFLDVMAKPVNGKDSPLTLYNTRVNAQDAHEYYERILKILRDCVPPHTELLTFVRQHESLSLLQNGSVALEAPQELPIIQLFEKSGWRFRALGYVPAQTAERCYPIRFSTDA